MNVITSLARLTLEPKRKTSHIFKTITTSSKLLFKTSPCLLAEPLKKKKKLDPAVIKAREDRRKKKLEKQIRRLEKNARQLKPIEECEVPISILDQFKQRQRKPPNLSAEVIGQRIILQKQWAKYKQQQHIADLKMLDRIAFSQQKALDELRKESEELYQEAIQIDNSLLPYASQGPVDTPPIENYDPPDGDYQDVSKVWD